MTQQLGIDSVKASSEAAFGDSHEYGGVKWHLLPTERLWLNAELFEIDRAPYSGAFTRIWPG